MIELSDVGETDFVIAVPVPSNVKAIAIDTSFLIVFFICITSFTLIFKAIFSLIYI